MNILQKEIVVLELAGNEAIIDCTDSKQTQELLKLGFILEKGKFHYHIDSMGARIDISKKLINLGALFSQGKDWSPADLLQHFSESGWISSKYRTVAWTNPHEVVIREV